MTVPLYRLQRIVIENLKDRRWLLAQQSAASPSLYNLAAHYVPQHFGPTWRGRWIQNWIRGFLELSDPYGMGRGGNWSAPLSFAWRRGREERAELDRFVHREGV